MKKRIASLVLLVIAFVWLGFSISVTAALEANQAAGQGGAVSLGGMESRPPADWKQQATAGQMRAYQFQIPKAEGDKSDAELVIFYFGERGAGSVAANVTR